MPSCVKASRVLCLSQQRPKISHRARGNDRLAEYRSLPLPSLPSASVQLLLSNGCFDSLPAEEHPFAELLLAAVAGEMKGCRDVRKMCLGAR